MLYRAPNRRVPIATAFPNFSAFPGLFGKTARPILRKMCLLVTEYRWQSKSEDNHRLQLVPQPQWDLYLEPLLLQIHGYTKKKKLFLPLKHRSRKHNVFSKFPLCPMFWPNHPTVFQILWHPGIHVSAPDIHACPIPTTSSRACSVHSNREDTNPFGRLLGLVAPALREIFVRLAGVNLEHRRQGEKTSFHTHTQVCTDSRKLRTLKCHTLNCKEIPN